MLTLALFVVALFVKGLTHDLLLEAGVFLVSVKLVLMNYKNSLAMRTLERSPGRDQVAHRVPPGVGRFRLYFMMAAWRPPFTRSRS